LEIIGFQANAKIQTMETLNYLRMADIIIPAGTALLAVWVMWNYDLTEEKAKTIKSELESRRGKL
jgi:glycoside/pentoside/hexuronide:cation symporter, GPH family